MSFTFTATATATATARTVAAVSLVVGLSLLSVATVSACPFCSAVGQTFTQEIEALDAAVIVESVELKEMPGPDDEGELPKSVFRVTKVLKGEQWTSVGEKIETHYFGERKDGLFLIFGADAPDILWTSPLRMNERGVEYLQQIMQLPEEGPERLKFFQGYLEDEDEMLSADAYDEFARAPYDEIIALKSNMKRDQILAWIQDTEQVPAARRRLYLTMLGVCGEKEDTKLLEKFMRSDSLEEKLGLDAMVACYLKLRGADGMPVIKELFLDNADAEYSHTYSAIMALRFHAAETEVLTREQVLDGLRCILDREDLADLVIPDLARMEDWDSLPRLIELFRKAEPGESWARVPIINFVRACPLPEAETALEKLREIDPAAVKRASTFFPFAPKTGKKRATVKDGGDTEEPEKVDAKVKEDANATNAANEKAASRVNESATDAVAGASGFGEIPQQTLYARTVSAEIALPDVGADEFATTDEYADAIRANPLGSDLPVRRRLRWPAIGALVVAGLLVLSLVWRGGQQA